LPQASKTSAPSNVINVLGAYYGDLISIGLGLRRGHIGSLDDDDQHRDSIDSELVGARYCSATRAMRTLCQGKTSCFDLLNATSADTKGARITGSEMCGFDPAPFAKPKYKGAVVFYECLATKAEDPFLYEDQPIAHNQGQSPRRAFLRGGETAGIFCSQPVAAAKSGTTGGSPNTTTTANTSTTGTPPPSGSATPALGGNTPAGNPQ
jgi:hypothetical protein